jgi:cobalt-zinc-cadmium efflux system membrane fusion protein
VKKICIVIVAAAMLTACSQSPQASAPSPKAAAEEPLRATVWSEKGELFLEYPALVVNHRVRFAVHLTRLSDFKAVKDATCEVRLARDANPEVFSCDQSTHPGIFGASVEPKSRGQARMIIVVHGKDLTETFDVGPVKVAADAASAEKPPESKEETIPFSKEQQWALDFGTHLAEAQSMRDSLRVAAETQPRAGGEAAAIAPIAGRVAVERTFAVGTAVEKGAPLASILPPTNAVSDLSSLQLAEAEAKVALEQAQRDRARAERLLAAGAVPARRAEDARSLEATLQARLQAAQSRLAQHEATRTADGVEAGVKRFLVRAPISGIIAEASTVGGANVEAGQPLFRIVDTDTVFVSGAVPESELAKLRQISGAEIEIPGTGQIRPVNRLVSVGRMVDEKTRTVAVTYETDNRDHRLALNQTVFLRLLLTSAGKTPVVPESAIIDDAGRPVVFVQTAGETFLRRPIKLGVRNGGMVQVQEGLQAGDRVVTKGAYLIRLSTMSSAVPAHGHVH